MYLLDENFVLFKEQTTATDSPNYINTRAEAISVQIDGTFSSGSFQFLGKVSKNANWEPIFLTINLSDGTVGDTVTSKGIYTADISSYKYFKLKINAISGGAVTAIARLTSL